MGLVKPRQCTCCWVFSPPGSIAYFGRNFSTDRSDILMRVGFASAYMKLPSQLTVGESLHIFALLYGLTRAIGVERS